MRLSKKLRTSGVTVPARTALRISKNAASCVRMTVESRAGWKSLSFQTSCINAQSFCKPYAVTGGSCAKSPTAMMRKPPHVPVAGWNYYIRVADIDSAKAAVEANGGKVLNGPMEVPGGDWVINGMDPQGAAFALVGARKG